MKSTRVAWGDFPPVVRNGLSMLSREPEYVAAKAGDQKAALEMVYRLMTDGMVQEVKDIVGSEPVRIVPIQAEEMTGRNMIPLAVAEVLAYHLDLEVEYDICQSTRVHRTGSSADHRLAFTPKFAGKVEAGKSYFIVDDTMTVGGTLAELRGYIASNGGNVLGAAVMACRESAQNLPITEKMLDRIRQKHGDKLNDYWMQEFGHGIDKLTQHEAGHLRAAASFDSIRDRITAARNAASWAVDERSAGWQAEKAASFEIVGHSEFRAAQIARAEAAFLRAQDEFWVSSNELMAIRQQIELRAVGAGHSNEFALKNLNADPLYEDLATKTSAAVRESPIAHAAQKRLFLTQRRLDRQYQPEEIEADAARPSDIDYS